MIRILIIDQDLVYNCKLRDALPCVGLIEQDNYVYDINMSMKFLDGKNNEIIELLINKMEKASERTKI